MKNYSLLGDEELIKLAQNGDEEAEETIIKRYKELVKAKARLYFIIGADSEDVVQEGMLGIFKAIRNYSSDKNTAFKTFAELCINRQILTAIQNASRKKHAPLNDFISLNYAKSDYIDDEVEIDIVAPTSEGPEEIMIMRDTIDKIFINANNIFSRFEQDVWYRYLQGKDYLEIADELGKTSKAIDNAMQRIKRKINDFCQEM